jgi:hypothetical protein
MKTMTSSTARSGPANVHSAEGWREVLEPVIARYREYGLALYFRGAHDIDTTFHNNDSFLSKLPHGSPACACL